MTHPYVASAISVFSCWYILGYDLYKLLRLGRFIIKNNDSHHHHTWVLHKRCAKFIKLSSNDFYIVSDCSIILEYKLPNYIMSTFKNITLTKYPSFYITWMKNFCKKFVENIPRHIDDHLEQNALYVLPTRRTCIQCDWFWCNILE